MSFIDLRTLKLEGKLGFKAFGSGYNQAAPPAGQHACFALVNPTPRFVFAGVDFQTSGTNVAIRVLRSSQLNAIWQGGDHTTNPHTKVYFLGGDGDDTSTSAATLYDGQLTGDPRFPDTPADFQEYVYVASAGEGQNDLLGNRYPFAIPSGCALLAAHAFAATLLQASVYWYEPA